MEIELKTSDKVYKHIEDKIIRGIWTTGEKIDSENFLAEQLKVSRVSVRDAIGKLVALGLLEKKKGGGSYVKEVSPANFMDSFLPHIIFGKGNYAEILELRSTLDVLLVKLFIENADDLKMKKIKSIHDKMEKNLNDSENFYQYDMEFHRFIAENSGNDLIFNVYKMLLKIMQFQAKEEYFKLGLETRVKEHLQILKAILDRDIEIAQLYMKRHLERSIKDMKNI
ncbi:MAG: FadR/GntR family transcriptional regulator [Fusobacteriaceae bacterium]